mgnify:CR=1 FL=1
MSEDITKPRVPASLSLLILAQCESKLRQFVVCSSTNVVQVPNARCLEEGVEINVGMKLSVIPAIASGRINENLMDLKVRFQGVSLGVSLGRFLARDRLACFLF